MPSLSANVTSTNSLHSHSRYDAHSGVLPAIKVYTCPHLQPIYIHGSNNFAQHLSSFEEGLPVDESEPFPADARLLNEVISLIFISHKSPQGADQR